METRRNTLSGSYGIIKGHESRCHVAPGTFGRRPVNHVAPGTFGRRPVNHVELLVFQLFYADIWSSYIGGPSSPSLVFGPVGDWRY